MGKEKNFFNVFVMITHFKFVHWKRYIYLFWLKFRLSIYGFKE